MEPVVVVDGSNVIHVNKGARKYFSVDRVKNVIKRLKKLGYTYKIGMKAGTYAYIMKHAPEDEINEDGKKALEELHDNLEISLLDAEKDDRWLHLAAISFDGYILSHDRFRDELNQWQEEGRHDIVEEIEKRRVDLQFFEDTPVFDLPKIESEESTATETPPPVVLEPAPPLESVEDEIDVLGAPLEEDEESTEDALGDLESVELDVEGDADPETDLMALIRIKGGVDDVWTEFSLPFDIPLGRAFFSEVLGLDEDTKPVLSKISRQHLSITKEGGGYRIRDLDSTNGTQFQGARVGRYGVLFLREALEDGSQPTILLGSQLLEVRL